MTITGAMPTHDLVSSYVLAKQEVLRAGYIDEVAWQGRARLDDVDPVGFLREAAWVVLSAGMAERIVRTKFPALAQVLHQWDPCAIQSDALALERAITVYRHRPKIAAIIRIASVAAEMDRDALRAALVADPQGFLTSLPYIGPVTWAHLAKNLGLPLAKADRHLTRLSDAYCRNSVVELCKEIAEWLGEPVAIVDVVLWRYSSLHALQCRMESCRGVPHDLRHRVSPAAL